MSQILIETRLNSLKLNESKAPRKGCLGRIEGICADYGNPTRNGRFYSRELWEHVFNDELVKESLKSKTLIGELDHPEDRFEPLAKEACVVMTDYSFDDENKVVNGGFDILDTPAGRILKSLLDYGCVMGVSSRGQGDIVSGTEFEEVSPDTYEFACFDVVTTPAVAIARQHVTESVSKQKIKSLSDSIIEQVNSSKTNSELDTILRVVESTEIPNLKAVKTAIKDKRKSIVEGKTISDKTKKDLHEAKIEINRLSKELEKQSIKTIEESKSSNNTISNLTSQILAYKHREQRLLDAVESLKKKLGKSDYFISEGNDKAHNLQKDLDLAYAKIKSLNNDLSKSDRQLKRVKENNQKKQDELDNLKLSLNESNSKVRALRIQLADKDKELNSLHESFENEKRDNKDKVKRLNESILNSKKSVSNMKSLLESFRDNYTDLICKTHNINKNLVIESLGNDYTPEIINKFINEYLDKIERYSKLSFSSDTPKGMKIMTESLKTSETKDEELEKFKKFMEAVGGVSD